MKPISRQSLEPLTGARFLAALWVVLYHGFRDFGFVYAIPPQTSQWTPLAILTSIINQGYLAVDFFFLLSGFILAYNYVTDDGTLRGSKRAFWVARIARIYPVYLLGIALGLFHYLSDNPNPALATVTIVLHLILVQSWVSQALPFDLNPPAWSLAAEALFYALFPLILPLVARLGKRMLPLVACASWGAYAFMLAILTILGQRGFDAFWWWGVISADNPLVRLPEFIVGLALGLMFANSRAAMLSAAKVSQRLTVNFYDIGTVLILGTLGAIFLFVTPSIRYDLEGYTTTIIALPLFALLIYALALRGGLTAWILSLAPMIWLGEISYGVYILHWPLWYLWHTYAVQLLPLLPFKIHVTVALILYLLLLVAVAGLSFRYFEGPTRRLIRAWWAKPQMKHAESSAPQLAPQRVEYDPLLVETVKRQAIPGRFE